MTRLRKVWSRVAAATAAVTVLAATAFTAVPAFAIVGGHESAEPYSFMGSLQRPDSPRDDLHTCGVTLIAPTWAVTAGHCTRSAAEVTGKPTTGHPKNWKVRFGSTQVDSGGDLVEVEQFTQVNNQYFNRDLALLKLARPAKAQPIMIAESSPEPGTPARIMGWGQTCKSQSNLDCMPKELHEADTQIQPNETCTRNLPEEIELSQLVCVGALDGSVTPANMDSGSPAIVKENGTWVLVGATEGGGDGEPSIYTNVPKFREWIDGFVSGTTPLPADTPFPSQALDGTAKLGGCSASIFKSANSQASDPAMLLTNGHCTGTFPEPGSATIDQESREPVFIMDKNGTPVLRANTTKLVYATMTGTDVAVYQLDRTYAQLAEDDVSVFPLAASGPQAGQQVQLLSGGSGEDWTCTVQAIVPQLKEGGYTQQDSIRYLPEGDCRSNVSDSHPDTSPSHGDSGSPLVDPNTREIVGIHNTGNDDGEQCTENNPCEVAPDGTTTATQGTKYGQQTTLLAACLTPGSAIDLNTPGCALTRPTSTTTKPTGGAPATGA